ncbi:hypothetical protein ACUOFU_14555 [Microbacterium arabinogalactanolyticum]
MVDAQLLGYRDAGAHGLIDQVLVAGDRGIDPVTRPRTATPPTGGR